MTHVHPDQAAPAGSPAARPVRPARSTVWWVLLTGLVSLGASSLGGRSLWCDEVLRLRGQQLRIGELLRMEHLRVFCTQTPAGYLLLRPWQRLLGPEGGGALVAALSAMVLCAAVLVLLEFRRQRPAGPAVAACVATAPLLLYYGSEVAFYGPWAAAGAVAFAALVRRSDLRSATDARARRVRLVTGVAGTLFVALHFAGLFVWAGLAGLAFVIDLRRNGSRHALRRSPELILPAVLNLPMYLLAAAAPEHIGQPLVLDARWALLLPALGRYAVRVLPRLTGGGPAGLLLALAGGGVLWRRGRTARAALGLAAGSMLGTALFLGYTHLRGYLPDVARFAVGLLGPALYLTATGLQAALWSTRRACRAAGVLLGAVLLLANGLVATALLRETGRPHPYRLMQRDLATLPPGRRVVIPNHYEQRFLGEHYPIPKGGRAVSPGFWEEGVEARVEALRRLLRLVPDAVLQGVDEDAFEVGRRAGMLPGGAAFDYPRGRSLRWTIRLGLYPEPGHHPPPEPALHFETMNSLEARAGRSGTPVLVPGPEWALAKFRVEPGALRFALVPPADAPGHLLLFVPGRIAPEEPLQLHLQVLAYDELALRVRWPRRPEPPGLWSASLPAAEARTLLLRSDRWVEGLPPPEALIRQGKHYGLEATPQAATVPLEGLRPGWSALQLDAPSGHAWLLLDAELR